MSELRPDSRVYVAGHRGLVGSAIMRRLEAEGFENLITAGREEVDLRDTGAVDAIFRDHRPEFVFLAAARVGGILANREYPGDFIRDNLAIQLNVLEAARLHEVRKLVFLGSSCIYPKHAPQPMKEGHLLSGHLEPTNRAYSVAKIAGIVQCQSYWTQYGCRFISLMPTNLYGPGDNFDLETSHVLPALLRKFHEARECREERVTVWGTGTPRREFLHVDDLADACLFLMRKYESPEIINVGVGRDIAVSELAELIREIVGFEGDIVYDTSKPDGMARKLLDVTRLRGLGWEASIPLREGIELTYRWFVENYVSMTA